MICTRSVWYHRHSSGTNSPSDIRSYHKRVVDGTVRFSFIRDPTGSVGSSGYSFVFTGTKQGGRRLGSSSFCFMDDSRARV